MTNKFPFFREKLSSICIASFCVFLGSKSYKLTLTWYNPLVETRDVDLWLTPARHDGSKSYQIYYRAIIQYDDEGMFYTCILALVLIVFGSRLWSYFQSR